MASNFKISTAARNAACDALVDRLDSGKVEIRDGSIPTNVSDASAGTLLASIPFAATAFGAASSGAASIPASISDSSADASGTASYFRCYASGAADTAADWQGTAGESADTPDLTFDNKTITSGGTVTISTMTLTVPIQ